MMKMFCFGVAGRPVTEKLTEVLFYNAHDMSGCRHDYGSKHRC